MPQNILSLRRFSLKRALTIVFVSSFLLLPVIFQNSPTNFGRAHSAIAPPKEIFSLWNDTSPLIDGAIGFSPIDLSVEWSSAAVYSMFDDTQTPSSKLILQNDNTNLYIGLDMIEYQVADPAVRWGCAIYLDRDHNGVFGPEDRSIVFMDNGTQNVFYNQYQTGSNPWLELEFEDPGVPLSGSNILVDHDFTDSYFESNDHHQYEIRIPLSILQIAPGNITGFAVEAFDDYSDLDRTITWPQFSSSPGNIFKTPSGWGDLYLGKDTSLSSIYAEYVFEENLNIKTDAVGANNGTFLALGDIDGDSDQELNVGSNRTVSGDEHLLAIYDYVSGELTRIWASWMTSHQTKMILPTGIATFDFDAFNGDEIYICSEDAKILRFTNWSTNDFGESKYVYNHEDNRPGRKLMGYIAIGDPDSDLLPEMVVGDDNGEIHILSYNGVTDNFDLEHSYTPVNVLGNSVSRIHAIEVADIGDADADHETLYLAQFSADNSLSPTALQIIEKFVFGFTDNPGGEDDLPAASSATTVDAFGHSIIVDDIDNDLVDEIIIVGKYSLKVFGRNTFTNPSPPLQIGINDNSSQPMMGGGTAIGDIDNDGKNELLVGFNNGTLLVLNVTDSGSDTLSYTEEWRSDIGASPGKREAMIIYDYDEDSENEAFIGDYFGQIIGLGSSVAPVVTITSPSQDSTKTDTSVLVTWSAVEDYSMHHYDVYVNSSFIARAGGGQTGMTILFGIGTNNVRVNGFDVTGKNDSHTISFIVSLDAPEVIILSPPNNHITSGSFVNLVFNYSDYDTNFDHYEIYRNGTRDGGDISPTLPTTNYQL
ncbi:MAG: VCBS repeat-containing protein, partial [Candidatus Heimdallarchaeota archaeon]|nr:VCBS repeat-containing protein [Candidatus Heimdallarchaeota archaeon]